VSVAVGVLGAGLGTRFEGEGAPKPLRLLSGRPLISWALDAALGSGLRPALLVVGARGEDVAAVAPEEVQVVSAPRFAEGIAHSLHALLDALQRTDPDGTVTAVCVGLADQPGIGSVAYRRLAVAHQLLEDDPESAPAPLLVATYAGRREHPVLIARSLWPEVLELQGDIGARALMDLHSVAEVECGDTGHPDDVDTVRDLSELEARLGAHED
jgi:molybdenum cofactor cytidylyltransferase